MAIWVQLDKKYHWEQISKISETHKLKISDWNRYDPTNSNHNGMRFGFASYTLEEIENLVIRLKKVFAEAKNQFKAI